MVLKYEPSSKPLCTINANEAMATDESIEAYKIISLKLDDGSYVGINHIERRRMSNNHIQLDQKKHIYLNKKILNGNNWETLKKMLQLDDETVSIRIYFDEYDPLPPAYEVLPAESLK